MTLTDFMKKSSQFALALGVVAVGFAAPVAVGAAQDSGAESSREGCAHEGRRGHGHHGRRGHLRRMARDLDLTEAQQTQIRAIMQAARANRGETRGENRGEGRAAVRAQVEAVLTPEQRARHAELRATHSRERTERRVARMTEHLSLSDTQASQVSGILRNAAMQRRALREQAQSDPASARAAMESLRERTQASVRAVLTAEQAEQFEAAHARRAERGHHGRRGHGRRGGN